MKSITKIAGRNSMIINTDSYALPAIEIQDYRMLHRWICDTWVFVNEHSSNISYVAISSINRVLYDVCIVLQMTAT